MVDSWTWKYDDLDSEKQPVREVLCALGNGYFVTRAALEEASAGGMHYPGTYLAGGYNRMISNIKGRQIESEDLVNWPNWLPLTFKYEDEAWYHPDTFKLPAFEMTLDLKRGVLNRRWTIRDEAGRETEIISRRLVSMDDKHTAALEWRLRPVNWSGTLTVRALLDGRVKNDGVERYRELNQHHVEFVGNGRADEDAVFLHVQTVQSHLRMAQACRFRVTTDGGGGPLSRTDLLGQGLAGQEITLPCEEGREVRLEKIVAVHTSRDRAASEEVWEACRTAREAAGFEDLEARHAQAWQFLWDRCRLDVEDGETVGTVLHLHIFHMLQTASMHTIDQDTGVPSRGWHGEAYRGHVQWDELYVFPFFNLSIPELTRALLMYRFRRLQEARRLARSYGRKGARFPWQSGSDGREESQAVHLNPMSGKWIPDNTRHQVHVNAAVAFNVWQYYQATLDREFMFFYGVELLVEIARYFADLAEYNEAKDRYEIHGVVGPDEYHTQYPGSDKPGLSNNAYTNFMAVWTLGRARDGLDLLEERRRAELMAKLGLKHEELEHWRQVGTQMILPLGQDGIIQQFEGFEKLKIVDWDKYRKKYGDIQRMDRILKSENDDPNQYQVCKQADVLMLFYLFTREEIENVFKRLGYPFSPEMIPRNIEYYQERTSHGSTLSRVVYAWVLARLDRARAWHYFNYALRSDVDDVQGGTTSEGIHHGAMAGTVDLVQRCFCGLEMRDEGLWLNPQLPEKITRLRNRIRFRGHWLELEITPDTLRVRPETTGPFLRVGVAGHGFQNLRPWEWASFDLQIGKSETPVHVKSGLPR